MAKSRKLFLSLAHAVGLIASGSVTEAEASEGIFYLDCTREQAFEPWRSPRFMGGLALALRQIAGACDAERLSLSHGALVRALRHAESEGRAAWRTQDADREYSGIDTMLVRSGAAPISAYIYREYLERPFSPAVVREAIDERGYPYAAWPL